MTVGKRWVAEQVAAIAPRPAVYTAAQPLARPAAWSATGCDERSLWGRCSGSSAEPYEVAVDYVGVATRCSCPSRLRPCKHALALLLLWVTEGLPERTASGFVPRWPPPEALTGRSPQSTASAPSSSPTSEASSGQHPDAGPGADAAGEGPKDRSSARDERIARTRQGLVELDRWLQDRLRTGLADPALARYATWDELAARLVDARAGALANRIRRLAGAVGATPDWHSKVLAELGMLHLLAQAGLRIGELPAGLADGVATATGWQVRQADVLAGVPETDVWLVLGRSDTREDRIEVRRIWLRGLATGRWAMLLSFAAYQQSLDASLEVGACVRGDLHRYPGVTYPNGSLRALLGERQPNSSADLPAGGDRPVPPTVSVGQACAEVGEFIAREPWIERVPCTVLAAPARLDGRWVLTDESGSLPLVDDQDIAVLLAASGGGLIPITVEWTAEGAVVVAVHLDDRTLDIGSRVDPSFVGAVAAGSR